MSWKIPELWQGDDCWIIGGGASVPRQFGVPQNIIDKVQNGESASLYSPYMKKIHDKHIIGINSAYMIGDWIDIVFFGDRSWFFKNRASLANWPGLKITCVPALNRPEYEKENIKFVQRNRQGRGAVKDHKSVSWNSNSGGASISLAASLGVKTIYLLGFDMDLDSSGRQHFHGYYNTKGDRRNARKLPFDRHLVGFAKIKQDIKRLKIKIVNVSPDSKIKEFEKCSLSDVL